MGRRYADRSSCDHRHPHEWIAGSESELGYRIRNAHVFSLPQRHRVDIGAKVCRAVSDQRRAQNFDLKIR